MLYPQMYSIQERLMNLTITREGELRLGVNDTDPMYMRLELPPDGLDECRDCIYVSSEDC